MMKLVPILPLLAAVSAGIVVAGSRPAHADTATKSSLRLMTFNVNFGNPDPDDALAAIEKADVDIVLLQEITAEWKKLLAKRFAKQYPHQVFRIHTRAAGGLAVLSKQSIKTEEVLASPLHGWFPAQRLVVDSTLGSLQILNVHLRPAVDGGSWIKGFMTTPPLRRKEIETYWKKLTTSGVHTVVAGDFNEDPTGTAVAFLENNKLARVVTSGPTTWRYHVTSAAGSSDVLTLDIDHVMLSNKLTATASEVIDAGASDHRPVVVTIEPR